MDTRTDHGMEYGSCAQFNQARYGLVVMHAERATERHSQAGGESLS